MTKTGECLYFNENGILQLAESFVGEDGYTFTTVTEIKRDE